MHWSDQDACAMIRMAFLKGLGAIYSTMENTKEKLTWITRWLNRFSLVFGVLIAFGYIYLAIPTFLGIALGVIVSLSNAFIMWITSDNALQTKTNKTGSVTLKGLFITVASCSVILCSMSVFIHTYSSLSLLTPFLPASMPVLLMTIMSTSLALFFSASVFFSLLFSYTVVGVYYRELIQKTSIFMHRFKPSHFTFQISPIS